MTLEGRDTEAKQVEANSLPFEILRVRFGEVTDFLGERRNLIDIEGVHQLRVAIRRLRSALRDFSPLLKNSSFKNVKKELKEIADSLGEIRDQDVAIVALETLREEAKSERVKNDLTDLITKRRRKRESTQAKLDEILNTSLIDNLRKHFTDALATESDDNAAANVTLNEIGRDAISNGLRDFRDLSDSLYDPADVERLHRLRIAAKRLRYAIELFAGYWGETISPFAKEFARMQTFLGEIHDCDVCIEDLSRSLRKKKIKMRRTKTWLLSRFIKTRVKNYRSALSLWRKWRKKKLFKELEAAFAMDFDVRKPG